MSIELDLSEMDRLDFSKIEINFTPEGNLIDWIMMSTNFGLKFRIKYSSSGFSEEQIWRVDHAPKPNLDRLDSEKKSSYHETEDTANVLAQRDIHYKEIVTQVERYAPNPLIAEILASAIEERIFTLIRAIIQAPGPRISQTNLLSLICMKHSGSL